MLTILTFVVMPRKVYENLKLIPQWGITPSIVVVCGLVLINVFRNFLDYQSIVPPTQLILLTIVATLIIILVWFVISTYLYLFIVLINAQNGVTYKSLFSIVSYCGVFVLIDDIINFLLIRANIVDSKLYAIPTRFPIGLDILAIGRTVHPTLAVFLHSINPIYFWCFTSLSIGLSIVAGLNKTKARMLSLFIWFIVVGIVIFAMVITGGEGIHIRF